MDKFRSLFAPFLTGEQVNGEYVAFCPAHENPLTSKKPSAQINFDKKIHFCFVCIPEKHEATLSGLAKTLQERIDSGDLDWNVLIAERGDTPSSAGQADKPRTPARGSKRPVPTEEQVAGWREALADSPEHQAYLTEQRLLTPETIDAWEIGYSNLLHRYTLPVRDAEGKLVDARCRSNNPAAETDKYIWWHGGATPLFGLHKLSDSGYVVVAEGELDAILMWQGGINAVSGTAGANTWKPGWDRWLAGRDVYFCYDTDEAGLQGRARATRSVRNVARAVYWVDLSSAA